MAYGIRTLSQAFQVNESRGAVKKLVLDEVVTKFQTREAWQTAQAGTDDCCTFQNWGVG